MRTTVVPAQITTVEDRIAGNLTFSQVLLLIVPLLTSTATYALMAPRSHIGSAKLLLIGLQFMLLGGLALRVGGKIVAEWLAIFLRFSNRPRIYVFTKNDILTRGVEASPHRQEVRQEKPAQNRKVAHERLTISEQARVDQLLENPLLTVRFELAKKGGVDVSLQPVKN